MRLIFFPALMIAGLAGAAQTSAPAEPAADAFAPWTYQSWQYVGRLSIDGTGRILSCRDESSGPAPKEGTPCGTFGTAQPPFALLLRGGKDAAARDTVVTVAFAAAPSAPVPASARGTSFAQMALLIDPAGKVISCKPLATAGFLAAGPSLCDIAPTRFGPLPAGATPVVRAATMTVSVTNPGLPGG